MPVHTPTTDLKRLRALANQERKLQKRINATPAPEPVMKNSLLREQRETLLAMRTLLR